MKVYLPSYPDVPPEKELTFDGEVDILVEVLAPTNLIILHMLDIAIKNVHVLMNGENIFVKHKSSERLEVGVFLLRSTIPADEHIRVKVIYTGVIQTDRLSGLYRTTYKDIDGSLKTAAVSQLAPSHARRIVPCFDEPDFKAKWTVTVIHPEGTTALSNGKEIDNIKEANLPWRTTTFEETPKMSTYILAIAVSEFKFVELYTKADVRMRVWSRPEALNETLTSVHYGVAFLDFFNHHFRIRYPLPKLDMVALPDFIAGAMENWGLVTYRELVLRDDNEVFGSLIVAHELAHQWFGNLVTLKWWNEIWLNEGFATYMSFVALAQLANDKSATKSMLIGAMESALQADSLATSHPLSFKIDKPVEVEEAFDTISYSKGASLLGMIAALMGEKNFNKGVRRYLMRFSYGNARSQDLWDVLDTVVTHVKGPDGNNLSMKKFANQWILQMGFPLVTVKAANSSFFEITQSRYKNNPNAVEVEKYRSPKYGFKWEVPVWYQLDHGPVKLAWLRRDSPLYILANTERSILVVNAERHGFYRQNYDEEGWRKIMKQLISNHKIYSAHTITAIINDAFAAAAINRLDYTTVLRLVENLARKKDNIPLEAAFEGLGHIRSHIHSKEDLVSFQRYMRKLLGRNSYDLLQASTFWIVPTGSYCPADAEECSAKYVKIFEEGILSKCETGTGASSCVELPIPERKAAYCYGVKELGNQAYDKVMELFKAETAPMERQRLISALGCHKDVSVLRRTLELAKNREQFRLEEVSAVFEAVASNFVGSELVFNYLLENWIEVYGSLRKQLLILNKVIEVCLNIGYTEEHYNKIKNFMSEHKEADELNQFHKALEIVRTRITWIHDHLNPLLDYFQQNQ